MPMGILARETWHKHHARPIATFGPWQTPGSWSPSKPQILHLLETWGAVDRAQVGQPNIFFGGGCSRV
jgi:hypothetical protein